MSPTRIAAVVLAAGMSRRMGRPKALLPLGGVPLLARVVEPILSIKEIDPVLVVTGHLSDQVQRATDGFDVLFVHNSEYVEGEMLSSVKAGIRAVADRCDALFLVLGDQPLVKSSTYKMLLDAGMSTGGKGKITQPAFEGTRGHPILFSADSIDDILALPPGATLKTFTRAHRDRTIEVPVDDPAILDDIDTPEDYERAERFFLVNGGNLCEGPVVAI